MSYVSVLLETLKRLKSLMPPPSSDPGVDSLSLAPSPAISPKSQETDSEQKLHRDNIKTISEEQESLSRSKAAIEDKIKDLETKKVEEEAIKRREMFTKLVNDVEEGKSRHRLFILLYNDNTRQSYFSTNCVHFFLHPLLGQRDNETILKINQIIEEDKTKNLISKSLYLHVKGRLNKLLQEVLGLKYLPGIKYYICLQKP